MPPMDLRDLQRNWNEFGRRNAFGSIISLTHDEGDLPTWDPDEFFATGVREIEDVVRFLDGAGIDVARGRALDFGCGVGRLTQALGRHFERVDGVDIAPSMIEQAREHNAHGDRCAYHVNDAADLSLFEDDAFDLIYSTVVLQHMDPAYSTRYMREFVRVLAPGGVALFDVPSEVLPPSRPMAPEAYRARIALAELPSAFEAGERRDLRVLVRNLGPIAWSGARVPEIVGQLRLGNHWLDRRGHVLAQDDGRTDLPRDIWPDEEAELELAVRAPRKPGAYILELDLVHEGVAWFAEMGSRTRKVIAPVVPSLKPARALRDRIARPRPAAAAVPAPAAPDDDAPSMEMHGVARAEVVELVEASGGRILRTDPSQAAGISWIAFRYCVTK